jgi:hypothetical protein
MDALLEALKRKRGAKIIMIDADVETDPEDPSVENLEEVEAEKDMEMDASAKAKKALEDDGNIFDELRGPKDKMVMRDGEDDDSMDDDVESEDLVGMEKEVADDRLMTRLKNGKKPNGIEERMQYNLMKRKKG